MVRHYTQIMLTMWVLLVAALACVAAISGITIGLVARSRHWPQKWVRHGAYYGVFVLSVPLGLAQEGLGLPYPPHKLAESGYPFFALMAAVMLISLSGSSAVWLARRVAGRPR
jgi:hypothetical protein